MMRRWWLRVAIPLLLLWFIGCGQEAEKATIQQNDNSNFTLMKVTKGEGAIDEAWEAIDGAMVNDKVAKTVNSHIDDFIAFSNSFHRLLDESPTLLAEMLGTDTRGLLGEILSGGQAHQHKADVQAFYDQDNSAYTEGFYRLLDDLSVDIPDKCEGNGNRMVAKVFQYWIEKESAQEFRSDMDELIEDLTDPDFIEDFTDLTKVLGKLLVKAHFPMWRDASNNLKNLADIDPETHVNMGLGNASRGLFELLNGLNEVMADEKARLAVHRMIEGLGGAFDPANDNAKTIREFISEMEDRFTKGGTLYETATDKKGELLYKRNDDEVYCDADLSKNLREFFPYLLQYFLRTDREMGLISDVFDKRTYPLEVLGQNFARMGWDIENARIEESIYDALRVDIWGRDRVKDPNAYHTSFLEGLAFFAALGAHMGYGDAKEETGEITEGGDPNYSHGHGKYVGSLTLNDSLFAMGTNTTAGKSMYDLSLTQDKEHYNFVFRGKNRYRAGSSEANRYRFNYDQDYPIGRMVVGKPGDMGLPYTDDENDNNDGGVPPMSGGVPVINGYVPYGASGRGDDDVALNTMSGTCRAGWEAEGPFFYAEANPETVTFDGREWSVYKTPGGFTYAWVYKNEPDNPETWEYLYPKQHPKQPMDDRAALHVQYEKPTHCLFTSNVDFKDGIYCDDSAWIEIHLNGESHKFYFNYGQTYTRDRFVEMIRDELGDICFPYDEDGKKLVQLVATSDTIYLTEKSFDDPLSDFLISGAEGSLTTTKNGFQRPTGGRVSVEVDTNAPIEVNLTTPSNTWTPEIIRKRFSQAGIDVIPFGYGLEIIGTSTDFNSAKVKVTTVSGDAAKQFFGAYDQVASSFLNRYDRYSDTTRSDYYLGKHSNNYYSIGYNHEGNFSMAHIPNGQYARSVIINENIKENDPRRLCTSHEEAIFRNYQFFFADRKFLIILPIHIALLSDTGFVFQIIEANGYAGVMNARKFRDNQVWAKKADKGSSTIPGDYRLCVEAVGTQIAGFPLVSSSSVYNDTIKTGVSFNAIFPHNSAVITRMSFPAAGKMNHGNDANGDPIIDTLIGSTEFRVGDEIWQKRNAILIILQVLWGSLHTQTENGYEGEVTRAGMRSFFDMMVYLLKPLFYYQKDQGNFPHQSWKPRITGTLADPDKDKDLNESIDLFLLRSYDVPDNGSMTTWYGSDIERDFFRPAQVPTIVTLLTDTDPYGLKNPETGPSRCDGILARLTEYDFANNGQPKSKLITGALGFFQRLGETHFDDKSDPGSWNADEERYEEWGARRKILYGLEQIVSAIRLNKAEGTVLNDARTPLADFYKPVFKPWVYSQGSIDAPTHKRDVDFHLDWGLDLLIGEDADPDNNIEGRGLANYPDGKTTDEDWKDLTDTVHLLEALLYKESKYCITGELIDFLDTAFAKPEPYRREDLKGGIHTLGRLLAKYNAATNAWQHQGEEGFNDMLRLLTQRLPEIHAIMRDETGATYRSTLILLADFLKENGLVELLVEDVCVDSGWKKIIADLYTFLGKDKITQVDPLWTTVNSLITDLARAVEVAKDISRMRAVYDKYGLQIND